MNANLFIRNVRITFQVMTGALIMLHLTPLMIAAADAASYTPLNAIRVIDRDVIRLSDVFTSVDPARDQAIGPAPRPGQDIVLNARTLMKLAVAYNVKWRPDTASDQIILRREGTIIDVSAIEQTIRNELTAHGAPDKFSLTFISPLLPVLLPKDSDTALRTETVNFNRNDSTFAITLTPLASQEHRMTITGKVEAIIEIPVATQAITKGSVIAASDLESVEMKTSQLKNDMQLDAAKIVGLTARRNILAGRPIKAGDIEIPSSFGRGEKITLIYRSGPLELSAQGRALQDGRPGDRVRVVNVDSNKNLQGTVLADNRVVID